MADSVVSPLEVGTQVDWLYDNEPLQHEPNLGSGPFLVSGREHDGAHWWYELSKEGTICFMGAVAYKIRADKLKPISL